jgi:hypothetical protein
VSWLALRRSPRPRARDAITASGAGVKGSTLARDAGSRNRRPAMSVGLISRTASARSVGETMQFWQVFLFAMLTGAVITILIQQIHRAWKQRRYK